MNLRAAFILLPFTGDSKVSFNASFSLWASFTSSKKAHARNKKKLTHLRDNLLQQQHNHIDKDELRGADRFSRVFPTVNVISSPKSLRALKERNYGGS